MGYLLLLHGDHRRPGKGEPFGYLENFPESVSGQVRDILHFLAFIVLPSAS